MPEACGGHTPRLRPFILRLLLGLSSVSLLGVSPAFDQASQAQEHADRAAELTKAGDLPAAEGELRTALELAPNDPGILGNLGTVLAMEKKFDESTALFQRALKVDPSNLTLRRYLAANLWQLQRYSEARQNLQIILKQKPGDPPSLLLLGMVSENMKDYATAARTLAAVPDLVRQQPESVAALARSYYHIGNRDKARATLNELQPAGAQAVLLGAKIADEMQDPDEAKKLLLSVPETSPEQAEARYRLALVEYHARQFEASQRTLRHLIDSGTKSSDVYNLLGWCYQQQHQPAQAAAALEQAVGLDPAQESNYLDLGKILLANSSLPSALELARRTALAFPQSSRALGFKGQAELKVGQFTDAVSSYSAALHIDPSYPDAILGLAEAQFAAGQKEDARATFEAGIKRFPKDARFPLQYALALRKETEGGDIPAGMRADELLKSALAIDPSLAEAHYQLGEMALEKGKTPEALTHLQTAARLDPESAAAHFALARVYRRLGRKADAANELALYQKLNQESSTASPTQPDEQPPH